MLTKSRPKTADELASYAIDLTANSLYEGRVFLPFLSSIFTLATRYGDIHCQTMSKLQRGKTPENNTPTVPLSIPKRNGDNRQASALHILDHVHLNALALMSYPSALKAQKKQTDYSFPLPKKLEKFYPECGEQRADQFAARRNKLRTDGKFVICLDIQNFANSCNTDHLIDTLKSDGETLTAHLLNNFFQNHPDIGIASGTAAFDIFQKIYLRDFDNAMREKFGKNYFRLVDDMAIAIEHDTPVDEVVSFVQEQLNKIDLQLNPDKQTLLKPCKTTDQAHSPFEHFTLQELLHELQQNEDLKNKDQQLVDHLNYFFQTDWDSEEISDELDTLYNTMMQTKAPYPKYLLFHALATHCINPEYRNDLTKLTNWLTENQDEIPPYAQLWLTDAQATMNAMTVSGAPLAHFSLSHNASTHLDVS